MTSEHDSDGTGATAATDLVGQLIRSAGRRPEPPEVVYRQTLAAATAALDRRQRARRRRQSLTAIAASVVVALVAGLVYLAQPLAPEMRLAAVERVIGSVEWSPARAAGWQPLRTEAIALGQGARMRTHAGSRAGVVLAGGTSLRMAPRTEIEFESAARVLLREGTVYADTATAGRAGAGIEVATAHGIARDVGTQFEVALSGDAYRLRTREGRVLLQRGAQEVTAAAGEEIAFSAAGPLRYGRVARDDPAWDWVADVAPAPDIEGKPVQVLLDWVARETGRDVRFADEEAERMARTTKLHGTIHKLAPMEALAVMLATTDLAGTLLPDGTILVTSKLAHAGLP